MERSGDPPDETIALITVFFCQIAFLLFFIFYYKKTAPESRNKILLQGAFSFSFYFVFILPLSDRERRRFRGG